MINFMEETKGFKSQNRSFDFFCYSLQIFFQKKQNKIPYLTQNHKETNASNTQVLKLAKTKIHKYKLKCSCRFLKNSYETLKNGYNNSYFSKNESSFEQKMKHFFKGRRKNNNFSDE